MSAFAERVAAGAAWLDENLPGWEHLVNLGRLDMADECLCVLGQVFGEVARTSEDAMGFEYDSGYDYADRALNASLFADGFYLRVDWSQPDAARDMRERYVELGTEWKRLIAARRSGATA